VTTTQNVRLVRKRQMDTAWPELPLTRPAGAPPSFHVLAKPSGAICNLDCDYCFFLSKEALQALYPGDRFRMSEELLEHYVRQVIESQTGPAITLAWLGASRRLWASTSSGESSTWPSWPLDPAKRSTTPSRRTAHCSPTSGASFCTTRVSWSESALTDRVNCTIVIAWTRRDDPRSTESCADIRLVTHGVEHNVLCTVNAANQRHPLEVYRFRRV
jgi:uncharacterized protein